MATYITDFEQMAATATGHRPYRYQQRIAEAACRKF
jgi:hypothetical protein